MPNPQLSIIIVNYNTMDDCIKCIQSIHDRILTITYEVIVCDNGSSDGSVDAIKRNFPWVHLIDNKQNIGFGRANNRGAVHAKSDILFFLNPDTVIDHGIEQMCMYMIEHEDTGLIGPIVLDQNNNRNLFYPPVYSNIVLQFMDLIATPVARLNTTWKKFIYNRYINRGQIFNTECVIGCAMMFRKDAYLAINGFDERIFMYLEEFDICRRLKKRGYKVQIFPQAVITHYGGHSTKKVSTDFIIKIGTQSFKRVLKKHFPHSWYIRYYIETLTHIRQVLNAILKVIINAFAMRDNSLNYKYIRSHIKAFRFMRKVLREKD